jgi:hypothetical protein
MTAEIAIMNKGAIALAADSAVSVERPGGPKIYNSVNKLFMLSQYHPVGIMVYGVAEFIGVPWETIIKVYRQKLGMKVFSKVDDYAADFLAFLTPSSGLFSKEGDERYVRGAIAGFLHGIRKQIDDKTSTKLNASGEVTEEEVLAFATEAIGRVWAALKAAKTLRCFKGASRQALIEKYRNMIQEVRQEVFQKLPLPTFLERRLVEAAVGFFVKDRYPVQGSGVVVAGFGNEEHYPSIVHMNVDGFFGGRLRYSREETATITDTNSASIMAFAQKEMVHTFMEGIDPLYKRLLDRALGELFRSLPSEIVKAVPLAGNEEKEKLVLKLTKSCSALLADLKEKTKAYRQENHIGPVIDAVTILPKDELAAMAESLVNLTSFKRRITLEAETVGGPIDVAVISKGDGFIWIRRKHYFDPKLNVGFFANTLRQSLGTTKGDSDAQT